MYIPFDCCSPFYTRCCHAKLQTSSTFHHIDEHGLFASFKTDQAVMSTLHSCPRCKVSCHLLEVIAPQYLWRTSIISSIDRVIAEPRLAGASNPKQHLTTPVQDLTHNSIAIFTSRRHQRWNEWNPSPSSTFVLHTGKQAVPSTPFSLPLTHYQFNPRRYSLFILVFLTCATPISRASPAASTDPQPIFISSLQMAFMLNRAPSQTSGHMHDTIEETSFLSQGASHHREGSSRSNTPNDPPPVSSILLSTILPISPFVTISR